MARKKKVKEGVKEKVKEVAKPKTKEVFEEYLITDPSYVLTWQDWDVACKELDGCTDQYDRFNAVVTARLNELAGTKDAVACETGAGDWKNAMTGSHDREDVIYPNFFADSGMVCVVKYNEAIKNQFEVVKRYGHLFERGGAALVRTKGKVKITMDRKFITVVKIKDEDGSFSSLTM